MSIDISWIYWDYLSLIVKIMIYHDISNLYISKKNIKFIYHNISGRLVDDISKWYIVLINYDMSVIFILIYHNHMSDDMP